MNIREKLKTYTQKKASISPAKHDEKLKKLGGEKIILDAGHLWEFRCEIPLEKYIFSENNSEPDITLSSFFTFNPISTPTYASDLLFLDLETTALTMGTGNYPFLIGIGYLKENKFIVVQFFMEDYSSEKAILGHLLPYLLNSKAVVTYNGKSFDMPLLKSRFRINRVSSYPVDIHIVDLLFPCRKFYRNIYESCSLGTIEKEVLEIHRDEDIPGWLIPEVYFSFQKYGETGRIGPVLSHSRFDVTSLFRLLLKLDRMYQLILERNFTSIDKKVLINFASHIYSMDTGLFIHLMDFLGIDAFAHRSLFKKYSTALKRNSRYSEALKFWEKDSSLFSYIELAKHYEHRDKKFNIALEYAFRALKMMESSSVDTKDNNIIHNFAALKDALHKRINRLNRKLQRS